MLLFLTLRKAIQKSILRRKNKTGKPKEGEEASLTEALTDSLCFEVDSTGDLSPDSCPRDILNDEVAASDVPVLPQLPLDVACRVAAFLYDDLPGLKALVQWMPDVATEFATVKKHVGQEILQHHQEDIYSLLCRMCLSPLTYPVRLQDCGHSVCGRCAYRARTKLRPCPCGVRLTHRPIRDLLAIEAAHCKALWLLDGPTNQRRLAKHERPVRVGSNSSGSSDSVVVFGTQGIPSKVDPMDGLTFEGDFDKYKTCNVTDPAQLIQTCQWILEQQPASRRRFAVLLCPAHVNYSPYLLEDDWKATELAEELMSLVDRYWVRVLSQDDILMLRQCPPTGSSNSTSSGDGIEVRLTGWEFLAMTEGTYQY